MSIIKIHNVTTNEIIEREMNANELAQYEFECHKNDELKTLMEQKIAAKTALLNRLGITEDEAKLLLS